MPDTARYIASPMQASCSTWFGASAATCIRRIRAQKGLPDFDHYGDMVDALTRGDGFMTTGEVLLPEVSISGSPDEITVKARVQWTFPLAVADLVWGDSEKVSRTTPALDTTRPFGRNEFTWSVPARNWKWARLAVWDVAGNGALTNPVWR